MTPVTRQTEGMTHPLTAAIEQMRTALPMTEIEVRGIPMRVFDAAPRTIRELWEVAALHGDKDYLVYEDERLTYGEVQAMVRSLAAALHDDYGVRRGDRVAVSMRNYPEWVISYWAIVSLGAACVGMNAWWTTPEMLYGLQDSRPRVVIVDGERLERLSPILDELRAEHPLSVIAARTDAQLPADARRWDEVVSVEGAPDALPAAEIDPDDDACIFYTSGTTGYPKGAQLTHRGCITNLYNILFLTLAGQAASAAENPDAPPPPAPDPAQQNAFFAPTPLFHVTANNCVMYPATMTGAKLVLMYRWDAARALELIERERVTNFSGVPTMTREMLAHPDFERRDTTSLVGLGGGGAPLQPDLVGKIAAKVKGTAPSTGYGLTETCGIVTANSSTSFVGKPASCGPVVPTLDAKLIDAAGRTLPAGPDSVGELCVRGSVVIKGYLNRPEATAEAIQDGWFHTGDIARIDEDGFVYIVDRAKDMVLRGGENVYCTEVETAIYHHDAVAEAAVFGVPDERLGEEVVCAVVLHDGQSLSEEELQAFLAERIARHKIPAKVWFLDEPLPRNANGKFLKRELRTTLTGG